MTKNIQFEAVPATSSGLEEGENGLPVAESVQFAEEDETATFGRTTACVPEMVEILAPANLHEGYKFDANHNGVPFSVIVPAGGCIEGQVLVVPFDPNANRNTVGVWKDNLFACTRYGLTHPSFLLACFCPLLLLGQIMTRLQMDWMGDETSTIEWKKTFRTTFLISIFYKIMLINFVEGALYTPVVCSYVIYRCYLLIKVRRYTRERDRIPVDHAIYGDVIKSIFCHCCIVSQLARQTANYEIENARYFTEDGLAPKLAHAIDSNVEIV